MDLSPGMLAASLVLSTVGFGLFLYGKKQVRLPQLLVGIAMMVCPYFVSSAALLWSLGGALALGLFAALRLEA